MKNHLPKIIPALAALVLVYLTVTGWKHVQSLRADIAETRAVIQSTSTTSRVQLDAEYDSLMQQVKLITQKETSAFAAILTLAENTSVRVDRIRPAQRDTIGGVALDTYQVSLRGRYPAIADFLNQLERHADIFATQNVRIKPVDEATLTADIELKHIHLPASIN